MEASLQRGMFLIASPDFQTGFFVRAVVLLCEHTPQSSFGLVVNKSFDLELPEEVVNLKEILNPHVGFRAGGPVKTGQMMLLHNLEAPKQKTIKVCEGVYLGGDLNFLQEVIVDPNAPHVYLCFGHAAWSQGQLESEYLDGRWFVTPANEKYIFHTPPEKLWQQLLIDMGGKYSSLATIPEDLSVN